MNDVKKFTPRHGIFSTRKHLFGATVHAQYSRLLKWQQHIMQSLNSKGTSKDTPAFESSNEIDLFKSSSSEPLSITLIDFLNRTSHPCIEILKSIQILE